MIKRKYKKLKQRRKKINDLNVPKRKREGGEIGGKEKKMEKEKTSHYCEGKST